MDFDANYQRPHLCRSEKVKDSRLTAWRLALCVGLPSVLLPMLVGCYDAEAMIESRRNIAISTQLEEVDLGNFRVTLPNAIERTNSTELHFHVFGQVTNRELDRIEEELKKKEPEIRHRILIAARMMTIAELEDPKLAALRNSFAKVVNDSLEGEPVQSIGFYRFGYMNF